MSVGKVWTGSQWVPITSLQGPKGDKGDKGDVGPSLLNVQTAHGLEESYNPIANGQQFLFKSAAPSVPMQLTYTPPVDAWWEVRAVVGILQNTTTPSAYHYGYVLQQLTQVDVDGQSGANMIETQRADVQTYSSREVTRIWKLAAGLTYTSQVRFVSSGGTWLFNKGAAYLWMDAKAWAR